MSFRYRAFGLEYQSGIELPFAESDGRRPADVTIALGELPRLPAGSGPAGRGWRAEPGRFLLDDAEAGRLCVSAGSRIVVDMPESGDPMLMISSVLGSGSAALLQQRGVFPIHGSAIALGAEAVAFAGPSGAGKSTLLAEFLRRGHAALTDDVLAPDIAGSGEIRAQPGYPRQKLWRDALRRSGRETTRLRRVSETLEKYYVPIPRFQADPLPLAAVFRLRVEAKGTPSCTRLPLGEALGTLVEVTYRRRILQAQGMAGAHFQALSRMVRQVPVFRLTRIAGADDVSRLADLVERAIRELR